jgi:Amt family ammonium transporter
MYAVKLTGTLRISEAGEMEGLDLHEHGASGYPEFVVNRGMFTGAVASRTPVPAPTASGAKR